MSGWVPSAEHSIRLLYESRDRALLSTTELTESSPLPIPLPSDQHYGFSAQSSFATDFIPQGHPGTGLYGSAPPTYHPFSQHQRAFHQRTATAPISASYNPHLSQQLDDLAQQASIGSSAMNPFAHCEAQSPPSFSISSPIPMSATLPTGSFGDLPDSDDPFGIKAPISRSGLPTRMHHGFDLLDDVTFGFGLVGPMTRVSRRQMNMSSPDAGSLSGGSNAPSPSHVDASATSPFGMSDLVSASPNQTSPSMFAAQRQNRTGSQVPFPRQKRKHLDNEGHEYLSDTEEQRDMFDDLLSGVNPQMLDVDHLGMSGLARRISRDSQSSWESSGAEDETSWSGSYNGDQHTPYLSPHAFDQSVDGYSAAPGLFRSLSHRSDQSISTNGEDIFFSNGVDPHVINPHSLPDGPVRHPFNSSMGGNLTGLWFQPDASRSVDALADGLHVGMALRMGAPETTEEEGESTLRARDKIREGVAGIWSHPDGSSPTPLNNNGLASGLSTSLPTNGSWLRNRVTRGAHPSDRSSPRSSPIAPRVSSMKSSAISSLSIADYATLPTKRSRGRRPAVSSDIGLAPVNGILAPGMQAVPGGSAFDPQLNPGARAIEFCQTTKTGKPKKIFVCQVVACGKVFKRGEHLKRHVRSIHTDDKPFRCPWPTCSKMFNRHDNLNQHLRVHRVSDEGGHVLQGLSIGSDGVLRRDEDGERVEASSIGLNDVELSQGPIPLMVSITVYQDEDDD